MWLVCQLVIAELAEAKHVRDKDMRAFDVAQKKLKTLLDRFHTRAWLPGSIEVQG